MNICRHIVVISYEFWHKRRWLLLGFVALTFLAMSLYCLTISFSSDIQSMLPDKDVRFREDFELFSYAPFSRNILISLEMTDPDGLEGTLEGTADRITEWLKPPYFQQAVCGISQEQKIEVLLTDGSKLELHENILDKNTSGEIFRRTGRVVLLEVYLLPGRNG